MNTTNKWTNFIAFALIVLTSCTTPQTQPTPAPISTDTPLANMPNPASVYCEEQGNKLEIRTAADGSQSGVCIFPDGSGLQAGIYPDAQHRPGCARTVEVHPGRIGRRQGVISSRALQPECWKVEKLSNIFY